MGPVIEIEKLTKTYNGFIALNNIDLTIRDSSIWGLIGPNGAGKSTLIRILNQIITFDCGKIQINNSNLNSSHLKIFGYLPEERGMYKDIKIGDQLLYFAQLKGLSKNDSKESLNYWLRKFDIKSWANKKISELSKGMQQKVQFVSSVIHRPSILILDEPFDGFDPLNSQVFKNEIIDLHKREGCTIILSTHNMSSVEELCESITLLAKSNIILNGKISNVKEKYNENNLFEIIIKCNTLDLKKINIPDFFVLHINSLDDIHTIKIKHEKRDIADNNEIIKLLFNQIGNNNKIISYRQITPSMEDIFIDVVNNFNEKISKDD